MKTFQSVMCVAPEGKVSKSKFTCNVLENNVCD